MKISNESENKEMTMLRNCVEIVDTSAKRLQRHKITITIESGIEERDVHGPQVHNQPTRAQLLNFRLNFKQGKMTKQK